MNDVQQKDLPDCCAPQKLPNDALWIAQWRETGSRAALTRLVREHAGRMRAMARVWSRDTALQDDLLSEGTIALIACLDGYVPRENIGFFAYARPFVRAAMRRTFYQECSIVTFPLHAIRLLQEGRASPLDHALFRGASHPEQLDLTELQLGGETRTGEALLIQGEVDGRRSRALEGALAALTRSDRLLVERHRGEEACSLGDLARRIGVSPMRALRFEARALARLRTQLILQGITSSEGGEP